MQKIHVNSADLRERIKEIRTAIAETPVVFIAPRRDFERAIEQDTMYLVALGNYIDMAQKQMAKLETLKSDFEAAKLRVELYEAIGKYQANQQLVTDKETHFNNVFLPMYTKELEESAAKFKEVLDQAYTIEQQASAGELPAEFAEKTKEISLLDKELKKWEDNKDLQDDEEYRNFTYKILKRLVSQFGN